MNVSVLDVPKTLPSVDQVSDQLTYEDLDERSKLETQVKKTFYEKGKALEQIRDRKLYRDKWKTFEDYCKDRFGFAGDYANKHILAAGVFEDLKTNCSPVLPTNESQCRELTGLLQEHRLDAWDLALAMANGRVPPAAKVKKAVKQIMEELRQNAMNNYKPGDVCLVTSSDVKGKKGHWCIVQSTKGAYCHCTDYLGEFKAHAEDLKYLDFDPGQKVFMQFLCDRLSALGNADHVIPNLNYFAKLQRGFLTDGEEHLLNTLELNP